MPRQVAIGSFGLPPDFRRAKRQGPVGAGSGPTLGKFASRLHESHVADPEEAMAVSMKARMMRRCVFSLA